MYILDIVLLLLYFFIILKVSNSMGQLAYLDNCFFNALYISKLLSYLLWKNINIFIKTKPL